MYQQPSCDINLGWKEMCHFNLIIMKIQELSTAVAVTITLLPLNCKWGFGTVGMGTVHGQGRELMNKYKIRIHGGPNF